MRLAHTMLRVRDLDRAVDFYTNFLGLREVRRHGMNDATLVFLTDASGHYHLELTHNHDGRDYELGTQFGHVALHVDDLEAVVEEVVKRGWWYRRSNPKNKTKYIFVHDPDGYDIEILEAPTRASEAD
ncbi:MAG: lactoylglutathione lyase [Planctomycetes bacterium]|nr:lactoylglutathione lyase [Planctomycetota bacterium]MCP4772002.1 lactoylglutathione lyase [Planctomycetota bacterium]MCP4860258.1 lactoylglutathione lyase [Planctomycetota bacterium]